jgi:hypothetical protein
MQIKVFTFNISELNKHIEELNLNEFQSDLRQIFQPLLNTIYFISTQEDRKKSFFIDSVIDIFDPTEYMIHSSYYASWDKNFNVHGLVIVPMKLYQIDNFNFSRDKILSHNLIGSKGSIIVQLSNSDTDLFFIGSHLPMDKHKEDLGFNLRVDAMQQVIQYLRNNLDPKRKYNILWTGDLNFRIDNNDNEQLNYLLDSGIDPDLFFEDLSQIYKYGPTCKTVMYDEKKFCDDTCKTTGCDNSCYDIEGKKGKRTPSYCDRVIGYNNFSQTKKVAKYSNFNTVTYTAKDYDFIKYSDHNPIMTTVNLPDFEEFNMEYNPNLPDFEEFNMEYNPNFKGGRSNFNYYEKYIKYYNKYKNY